MTSENHANATHSIVDTTVSTVAVSGALLAEIAIGLGQSGVERLVPEGNERRWALVLESEAYEAWVIAWPPGTGLAMHDHDGSLAAMTIVRGRLRERFVIDPDQAAVRWLAAGDTVVMPTDHTHEVINVDLEEVVSIHVYSPRLVDQTFRETQALS